MAFQTIAPDKAPAAPVSTAKRPKHMTENETYISEVAKSGQVGVITPEGDETVRSLKVRLFNAAKRLNVKIKTWDVDGKVYVTMLPAAANGKSEK